MSRPGRLQSGSLAWFAGRGWAGTEEGQPLQLQERGPLIIQQILPGTLFIINTV